MQHYGMGTINCLRKVNQYETHFSLVGQNFAKCRNLEMSKFSAHMKKIGCNFSVSQIFHKIKTFLEQSFLHYIPCCVSNSMSTPQYSRYPLCHESQESSGIQDIQGKCNEFVRNSKIHSCFLCLNNKLLCLRQLVYSSLKKFGITGFSFQKLIL